MLNRVCDVAVWRCAGVADRHRYHNFQKEARLQLFEFIRTRQEDILRDWDGFATTLLPASETLDRTRFNEAVDELLAASAAWFDTRLREIETVKREAERARERERESRAMTDLNPAGMLVNQAGRLVHANTAAVSLLGYRTREQLIGKSPYELVEESFHHTARERIEAAEAGSATPLIEQRWKKANGENVEVAVVTGPTPWEGTTAVLVIAHDITERKSAEQALRQSVRAKDEFLAILGHELRNPLAPLRTGLNLLERAPRDPDLID